MTDKKFYRNSLIAVLFSLYILMFWILPIGAPDGYIFTVTMLHASIITIGLIVWLIVWLTIKYEEAE